MNWNWGPVESGRAARALKVKAASFDLNSPEPSAEFIGSSGARYTCTLEDCTCPDFSINENKGQRQPCKHITRLAMELGILNRDGRTPSEQKAVDISQMEQALALYAWHYYVLDSPDISDKEYDELKSKYMSMISPGAGS